MTEALGSTISIPEVAEEDVLEPGEHTQKLTSKWMHHLSGTERGRLGL